MRQPEINPVVPDNGSTVLSSRTDYKYGPVTFAFEVDEQTGTVSHAYPYLADYPNQYVSNNTPNYYRVRSDDTISIYNGTTLVLAYNSTTFIYPEDWFKEELQ